jgi:hypothetical protein
MVATRNVVAFAPSRGVRKVFEVYLSSWAIPIRGMSWSARALAVTSLASRAKELSVQ